MAKQGMVFYICVCEENFVKLLLNFLLIHRGGKEMDHFIHLWCCS